MKIKRKKLKKLIADFTRLQFVNFQLLKRNIELEKEIESLKETEKKNV